MLADRVGFGKSAQYTAACDLIGARKIIVVSTKAATVNQSIQFDQWSAFGYVTQILESGEDKLEPGVELAVVPYGLLQARRKKGQRGRTESKIRKQLREWGADVLILDEAHRAKSMSSQQTIAIFGKAGIANTAQRVWFVTGTPTPNNASEWFVFGVVAGLWPDDFDAFVMRYCTYTKDNFGYKIVGTNEATRAELLEKLRPYVLMRSKPVEGVPIPVIDDAAVIGSAPDFAGILPETLERITAAVAAGDMSVLDDPSTSTVRRLVGTAKARGAADLIVSELEGTDVRGIAFAAHTDVIETVADRASRAGLRVAVLDGRTKDKAEIVARYQRGDFDLLVAHIIAAGESLTITRATRVWIVEAAWTPDGNKQAIARAVRRGQTQTVHATFLWLVSSSFDAALSKLLARKTADIAALEIAA